MIKTSHKFDDSIEKLVNSILNLANSTIELEHNLAHGKDNDRCRGRW
jgi:hypothetical protein